MVGTALRAFAHPRFFVVSGLLRFARNDGFVTTPKTSALF
jgi:hypothetical protein